MKLSMLRRARAVDRRLIIRRPLSNDSSAGLENQRISSPSRRLSSGKTEQQLPFLALPLDP